MSGPIGDGNGTLGGCRTGFLLAVLSILVVLTLVTVAAIGVGALDAR